MNSSLNVEFSSHHEPQDVFDEGFQLPAPWAALSGSIPNGVPGIVSLPFPAYDLTSMNRTSSAIVHPLTTGTSLSSLRAYRRNVSEGNGVTEDDPYDTTIHGPNARFPKAKARHKVAWGSSSRPESEPKSLAPPDNNKRSINGNHTFRRAASKKPPGPPNGPKSDSDSDRNHRSKNRFSHDQTEKRYRKRLNYQFENLLSALPVRLIAESEGSIGGPDDRREKRISKADVLMLAKGHIEQLERKQSDLEVENRQMSARAKDAEERWKRLGCGEMCMS
jgi:Helix-loop-helix DNA-binding domain